MPLYVAQQTITRADVGLRSERGPILASVMLSVALVALDSTIIATAVGSGRFWLRLSAQGHG